jgi:predicted transcriptional regulator
MDPEHPAQELLTFFKALADANRLRIVGLLSQEPFSVEQLAAMLDLRPSTVSHHLSRLSEAGLVAARAEGYYSVYALSTDRLEQMARRLLAREDLPAVAEQADLGAYDRKVVRDFVRADGRLRTIPAQRKKLNVILELLARRFQPGKRLTEKQVNSLLKRFHPDTSTLRRELVGAGLLQRAQGIYWRPTSSGSAGGRARKS